MKEDNNMMNTASLILDIKSEYPKLTKTEKKVADFVIASAKEVLYLSIVELADACQVGDTSVYRFCRSIGLKGYQEFKMRLSLSLSDDISQSQENKGQNGVEEYANNILEKYFNALKETHILIDEERILKLVEYIEVAEKVYFFGVGNSGISATDARNKFIRITPKVQYITDTHIQAMAANMMTDKDLIIIISYSGETQESIDIANIAKSTGAKVVCITRYEQSLLAQYTDLVVLCGAYQKQVLGGTSTMEIRIAQMYIIDLLYEIYYTRNQTESKQAIKRTEDAIIEKLYKRN